MIVVSFISMYVLMYAMVNAFDNVLSNLNHYMAALMTAPMVLIELGLMNAMYPTKAANLMIGGVAVLVLLGAWFAIREQAAIGDQQFLRSMIPHHAGAILMCRKAAIRDEEVRRLCTSIISSQQREIAEMKEILGRLGASR
jgi:hypothetical protein